MGDGAFARKPRRARGEDERANLERREERELLRHEAAEREPEHVHRAEREALEQPGWTRTGAGP